MDISVNHLNTRLALQLPAQLPLGLVFVQGSVSNLVYEEEPMIVKGTAFPASLDLTEGDCSIRCCLSGRVVEETTIHNGDRIRAGGHLIFNTAHAQYELLARDVEIVVDVEFDNVSDPLDVQIGRPALTPVLADIKKRAETARLAQGELPIWVQRMAPPEVKKEMGLQAGNDQVAPNRRKPALDDDLVQFLSAAMEKPDDVEITPNLLEEATTVETAVPTQDGLNHQKEGPAAAYKHPYKQPPQPVDWPLILLMLSVVLLAAALFLIFLTQSG